MKTYCHLKIFRHFMLHHPPLTHRYRPFGKPLFAGAIPMATPSSDRYALFSSLPQTLLCSSMSVLSRQRSAEFALEVCSPYGVRETCAAMLITLKYLLSEQTFDYAWYGGECFVIFRDISPLWYLLKLNIVDGSWLLHFCVILATHCGILPVKVDGSFSRALRIIPNKAHDSIFKSINCNRSVFSLLECIFLSFKY